MGNTNQISKVFCIQQYQKSLIWILKEMKY